MARHEAEHCYRCGHVWSPHRARVRICPRCKSPYFWYPKVSVPRRGRGLGIEDVIGPKKREVVRLARQYGAFNVRVFGSVARHEATPTSDVDLMVDAATRGYRPIDLGLALRKLLGRSVDLVEERSLHWLIQPRVVAEAVPL
jgi:uncharacterized protein